MRPALAAAAATFDLPSKDTGQQAGGVDISSVAAQGDQCAIEEVTPECDAMDAEDTISLGESEEPFTFDVYMSLPHPAPSSSPHSPQPSGSSFSRHSTSPLRRSSSPVRATSDLQRYPHSTREPTPQHKDNRFRPFDQSRNSLGHNNSCERPTTTQHMPHPQSWVQYAVAPECPSGPATSSSILAECQGIIGRRAHTTGQLPPSASALPPPSFQCTMKEMAPGCDAMNDDSDPLTVQRESAVAFILHSFSPSATNTQFGGPEVRIGNVDPPALPDSVRQECRLGISATTELRLRYWHLVNRKPPSSLYYVDALPNACPIAFTCLQSSSEPSTTVTVAVGCIIFIPEPSTITLSNKGEAKRYLSV
jgi:hypothetical protein